MQDKKSVASKAELLASLHDLTSSETFFRTIAESAPVMLWMTNGLGKMLFSNQKWRRFSGINERDDPNIWVQALHPDNRDQCLQAFQRAFAAQVPFRMEYQLRRSDGEYRWILDIGEPHYDRDGRFAGFIGSSQDITQRKRAEQALQESYTELQRQNQESDLLSEMNNCLQVCHSIEETHSVIQYFAGQLFNRIPGFVSLINASRTLLETIVDWNDPDANEGVFSLNDCWALKKGKLHQVVNPISGLNCKHMNKADTGYLCLPMNAYGETQGILHLQLPSTELTDASTETNFSAIQNLAVNFANQVALALTNLKLREALEFQSVRDPLTQLFNRRYLLESLEQELAKAKRHNLSIGVVVMDIDHFKRYNDSFGHDAGDAVLREFGYLLRKQSRTEDIPCRYGGEEFVMVMTDIDADTFSQRCEQIREKTKQLAILHLGQMLGKITVSMGLSLFPSHGETSETLIKAADEAMYLAKQQGRDCVRMATEAV